MRCQASAGEVVTVRWHINSAPSRRGRATIGDQRCDRQAATQLGGGGRGRRPSEPSGPAQAGDPRGWWAT
jgi:hypothetical protein